jgi:hypothetical protein
VLGINRRSSTASEVVVVSVHPRLFDETGTYVFQGDDDDQPEDPPDHDLDRRTLRLLADFNRLGEVGSTTDTNPFNLVDEQDREPLSVPTCEKVPTSILPRRSSDPDDDDGEEFDGEPSSDPHEQDAVDTFTGARRRNFGGDDCSLFEIREATQKGMDARQAIRAAIGRGERRQRLVVGLINAGEVSHALRLATCMQQSVQLGCSGCGCEENYIPMTCDSRLCPDCGQRRQGQVMGKYRDVISTWDHPTMLRLSLPGRVEATEGELSRAVDALRGAFGRLRRRVIPIEGEHQGKRWVWSSDGGEPADHYWKSALLAQGRVDLARRWQKRYVRPARHTVDDCTDCGSVRCAASRHTVDDCTDCGSVRCAVSRHTVEGCGSCGPVRCEDAGTQGHRVGECPDCHDRRCDLHDPNHRVEDCSDCHDRRCDLHDPNHRVEDCSDCHDHRCELAGQQVEGIPVEEVLGSGLYGVDAKQGEDGSVNVHLHILTDCAYLPQAALSSLWDDIIAAPVVDIRRVEERGERSRETALMETAGYAAKPPQYESIEGAVAYAKALKGAKLVQPFGNLHGNAPEMDARLLCAGCGTTPHKWAYLGTVDEALDTVGRDWTDPTQGENDPPVPTPGLDPVE